MLITYEPLTRVSREARKFQVKTFAENLLPFREFSMILILLHSFVPFTFGLPLTLKSCKI